MTKPLPRQLSTPHTCSKAPERCPTCGHEDTRDAFEGWETGRRTGTSYVVRCRECEEVHPDQSNWDDRECEPCSEYWASL